mmetsp:Transcript_7714/g.23359  ORF Transcript_7714/g.23359 Transcript_7714/m.23359 type:complete len:870 (-) Transcript_7714:67-2676(-)|eukprot:CAMPEP_0198728570 /NCGR_PEP_ID=MMETSP1475-20131203/9979_1 /TAXON_ID= ORGANISM="Unidentified sp., Strain CCMP1999" /NCGR_SAMPLE_ID=MMETSP1475 /ASSEMBLY_ACC=CAM_ASM_001111 /LENGTH=869 /DNA_ID=CAMNT_0044490969 /DNA_START=171 /DNA_END=2780 /DNA_ORIENTATION=+
MASTEDKRVVLPKNVKPVHYDLRFVPDLFPEAGKEPTFEGSASIAVKVLEATKEIVVNSKELKITSSSVCAGDSCSPATVSFDEKRESATFKVAEPLSPGDYHVDCEFEGVLNSKMMGFYRSEYKDPEDKSKTKYMAVTQFEATDARMAFPCFDEPNLKATFAVTMVAPKSYTCLSNMPITQESELSGDRKEIKFDKTPIMSTYLLAFVVAELDYIESKTDEGITVRVYTEKGRSSLGDFALECGVKVLSFFQKFFEIRYPLPKMDMIAIPDFSAGAMENWGLVTYRETALLLDPKQSSAQAKSRVAEVVAHELAHQWFGNLVTMDWWTHLWLNEGFATWAADLAVDTLFPEWKVWVQFVSTTFAFALRLDGLHSSHAIEVEINDASEVNEIFDTISYLKGASVIRMLANYLGVETFKKGLITYLNHFSYSNATTQDLWAHLENASGKPIKQLMGNWTKLVGYPVVEVSDGENLSLSQTRFLSDGSSDEKNPSWIIPIGYVTSKNVDYKNVPYYLMDNREGTIPDLNPKDCEWIKLNALQSGIFRVKYSDSLLMALTTALGSQTLAPEDRLSLLTDSVALARAGKLSTVRTLDIVRACRGETEYSCMMELCSSLSELRGLFGMANDTTDVGFQKLAHELLEPLSAELGWDAAEGEPHIQSLLRSLLIGTLIDFEHGPTINEAVKRFKQYTEQGTDLSPDLRLCCYNAAVMSLGEDGYSTVKKLYLDTELNEEKVRCIRALGAIKDKRVLRDTLEWGLSDVKAQDIFYVFFTVAKNRLGSDLAWEFLKEQWESLVERFGKGSSFATRFLSSCTKNFASEEKAREVEDFFKTATKVGITRTLEQSLESIRLRAAWLDRDAEDVNAYMTQAV